MPCVRFRKLSAQPHRKSLIVPTNGFVLFRGVDGLLSLLSTSFETTRVQRDRDVIKLATQVTRQVTMGLTGSEIKLRFSGARDLNKIGQTFLTSLTMDFTHFHKKIVCTQRNIHFILILYVNIFRRGLTEIQSRL